MVVSHPQLWLPIMWSLLLLLSITTTLVDSTTRTYNSTTEHYSINFGLPKSPTQPTRVIDNTWLQSDENFAVAPPSTIASSNPNTTTTTSKGADTPYNVARVFWAPVTYVVPVSLAGPKLVRLYFPPNSLTYNQVDVTKSYLNLTINGFEILSNFSFYLVEANANANIDTVAAVSNGLVREYYVTTTPKDGVNFTFAPSNPDGGFGLINGVEIVSVPDGLYVNYSSSSSVPYVSTSVSNYSFPKPLAMENIIRLNVGGDSIKDPLDDTGMGRAWSSDGKFVQDSDSKGTPSKVFPKNNNETLRYTKIPAYAAPANIYSSERAIGPYTQYLKKKLNLNLSWGFEVDSGFDYLVRLHFCELRAVNQPQEELFDIYINNQIAEYALDVLAYATGRNIPVYKDFVTRIFNTGETRVVLWVTLVPDLSRFYDAFLNGLEIFKLREDGSLAAPNPAVMLPPDQPFPTQSKKNLCRLLLPIVGSILGLILVSLAILTCFVIMYRKNKAKKKSVDGTSTQNSSKLKWISMLGGDSGSTATTTSVVSSLPSDLCRHFSLAQIRIATCDFDKKLILGKGGFGDVYKGSIIDAVDGTIQVAVKRLHTKSKQGANEFQTEIEMLSRLRHMHLVSLIGYCEDEGEMILVYEYMSRGTVRDHLMYKNFERNDPNKTPLSWKQRLMICIGSARGLHYLHAGARQLIIHRDVKTTNILLDDKWTAKVSDFGLSKAGPISLGMGPTHISTAVKGSAGYLDPEYYRNHQLTEKSDVYSFGVVLFEILCARAAVNPNLPKEQANLAMWARSHYKKGTLNTIVDKNIESQIAPECLRKFGEIAEICVRDRGSERPSMGDVVWGLEFAQQLQETAEKHNSLSGGSLAEVMGSTWDSKLNIGGDGNTDNEVFTNSGDNFSRSSNGGVAEKSKTTTSSSSDYRVNMISDSVFSEIIDPTGR